MRDCYVKHIFVCARITVSNSIAQQPTARISTVRPGLNAQEPQVSLVVQRVIFARDVLRATILHFTQQVYTEAEIALICGASAFQQ
jgi:hypothetical protein